MQQSKNRRIICTVTNDLVYDQRMIRICGAMIEAGFEVTLIGRIKKNSKPLNQQLYQQVRLEVSAEKGKAFYLGFHLALKRWLLKQKIDILYAVDLDTLMACAQVSKKKKIPFVYDAHEYFTEVPELKGRPFVKKIWESIAKKYIPKAAVCYTVSETLGEILSKKYNKKFHIIRNVPTLKPIDFSAKREPKIILYQGVLNKGRGIEVAILAMLKIDRAVLWLVGMGDLEMDLKALVRQHGLAHKVVFKGHIEPHNLSEITAQSWLGINLLEGSSLNYLYSLANKFFDYMMAGIPSINMDFPEYRTIIEKNPMGVLLEDLSPETLATAVNLLIEDSIKYQNLCRAAVDARNTYNWRVEKKKLIQILPA